VREGDGEGGRHRACPLYKYLYEYMGRVCDPRCGLVLVRFLELDSRGQVDYIVHVQYCKYVFVPWTGGEAVASAPVLIDSRIPSEDLEGPVYSSLTTQRRVSTIPI
jgi:hypothetical protein